MHECITERVPVNDLACDSAIMPMKELVLQAKCPVITGLVGDGGIRCRAFFMINFNSHSAAKVPGLAA